ncbi:hypothetical protein X875_18270 [Mannheimia varigena USDA-ARS-USMARC-1388]|uniref:hypothetical protein n=1 Tax=Mannheimia varigena TaxID=85404 RepID=UPI0003E3A5B9|nr:hypothetical protein [Mannheimia varigena]AHG80441.1 hypothetical protein X875_18270 [Mannheimia varigena USDA-ARS-USMARC-1388]
MQYYSMTEISNRKGIYEFKLGRVNAGNNNNIFSNQMTLIDQNIILSIEQDKKLVEIADSLRNKMVSPIFYFIERFLQNDENIEMILKDDVPRFNAAYKKISRKINIYKDRSIKNEDFIRSMAAAFSISNLDNGSYHNQMYLNFFYKKALEFNLSISDYDTKENLFNAIKEYDFSGVSPFVIMITIFSIFPAGHDAFFYKLMFPRSKNHESEEKRTKNSFGDLRYLLLMPYLFLQMDNSRNLEFRFITGDKNLSRVISRLNLQIQCFPGVFEYKINSLDIKRNLDARLLDKNKTTYSDIVTFFESVGIITTY